jgi:DNA gyrase/topoisomerase IV subunit A
VRARWVQEDSGRGTWAAVVTEIPWLVQKSRLVERMAELINEKKLPLVADVRDESRGHPPRHRAARAIRRSRADDGEPVQADRARRAASRST